MSHITIYTDGSALGNPGPGGYGIVLRFNDKSKELSEAYRLTTNNRMELLAVIVALESLKTKELPVIIHSDSKYVIDAITKQWVDGWLKKGFKGKKNEDLWRRYLQAIKGFKDVRLKWVKGHAGVADNERCDQLAVNAAQNGPHLIDEGYEQSASDSSNQLF
jgi:ribonuclease HI